MRAHRRLQSVIEMDGLSISRATAWAWYAVCSPAGHAAGIDTAWGG